MRRLFLLLLLSLTCASAADVSLARIQDLAKTFFRDSAEVPMTVVVATLVANPAGKVIHRGAAATTMVFHGYNQKSGKFTLNAKAGLFSMGGLRDSIAGDLAAFIAATFLTPPPESESRPELLLKQNSDSTTSVSATANDCPSLELMPRFLFLKRACGRSEFTVAGKEDGGLAFTHFTFAATGAPAVGNVPRLGNVQVTGFDTAVDFQEGFLPGDPKPFLWPVKTVVRIVTAKGIVTITNQYSPKKK